METDHDHPLTPAGRLFVQPLTNQIIHCAMILDFPFDVDAVKAEIHSSVMLTLPRFCSLMVRDSYGRELWRRTAVDLDRHLLVRRQPLTDDPFVSDEDAVNDFIADLSVSSSLPADKPLWDVHLLLAHNTLLFRMHHSLGDGISLMSMLLSCCRKADDPSQWPTIGGVGVSSSVRAPAKSRRSFWTLTMVVWYTLIHVLEFLLRVFWWRDKATPLRGGAGVELWPRKLASAKFRLDDMKIVKRAVAGATINDVLFGIISCGLSRYLDIVTSPRGLSEGLRLTGLAMINLRSQPGLQDVSELMSRTSGTRWGNKFGVLLLPVYYHRGDPDPIQFVKRAKTTIDKKKLSLVAPFSYNIGFFIMSLFGPKFASIMNYRIACNTTFTVSNVIGPQEKIMFANIPVKSLRVTSSSLPHAITMHMVSYAGIAELQILVAKQVIRDPKVLVQCFEAALLDMKKQAVVLP